MKRTGFTLIEVIMVLVILGIVAGIVTPFVANAIRYWDLVRKERELISTARYAVNRVVREIRQLKNTNSITTYTDTDFAFTRIKADGTDENVEFQQSGDILLRNSDELADDVQSLTFTYLDVNGGTTSTPSSMRMVRIQLVLESGAVKINIRSLGRFRNTTWE